jgi:MFS transporter, DHA1 family, tetracycline resistance protein
MSSRGKSLFAAYFILFLDNLGFAILFPLFPILLLNSHFEILSPQALEKTRFIYLGLLLAAFPFAQFFGNPFFGMVADRLGRKKALSWTISGSIFGYLLTAYGVWVESYALIFCSRLISGFFSANLTISMAILADMNFEKKRRVRALSTVSALLGASWMLSLFSSLTFTDPQNLLFVHPSVPFWIVGLFSFLNLVVLGIMYRETVHLLPEVRFEPFKELHRLVAVLEHRHIRVLYLILFFWFFAFFISLHWATPFSIEKFHANTAHIMGLWLLLGFLWICASAFLNPWLAHHFSLWQIILWSLFFVSLFYFFAAPTKFFFYFAFAYILSGIFVSLLWSNTMSLISLAASSEVQGKNFGMAQSIIAATQFFGPLFGGLVAGFSLEILFYTCSFLVLIGFLFLLAYVARRKNKLLKNGSYS